MIVNISKSTSIIIGKRSLLIVSITQCERSSQEKETVCGKFGEGTVSCSVFTRLPYVVTGQRRTRLKVTELRVSCLFTIIIVVFLIYSSVFKPRGTLENDVLFQANFKFNIGA